MSNALVWSDTQGQKFSQISPDLHNLNRKARFLNRYAVAKSLHFIFLIKWKWNEIQQFFPSNFNTIFTMLYCEIVFYKTVLVIQENIINSISNNYLLVCTIYVIYAYFRTVMSCKSGEYLIIKGLIIVFMCGKTVHHRIRQLIGYHQLLCSTNNNRGV